MVSYHEKLLAMQDVFGLFMWVFRKLEDPSSPSYQLTLSVLDTVSQVPESVRGSPCILLSCVSGSSVTYFGFHHCTGQMLPTDAGF